MKLLLPPSQPRISSNQLGEYIFGSEAKKLQILQNAKFPNGICPPYYTPAFYGILKSFQNGQFNADLISQEVDRIRSQEPETPYKATKQGNNILALRRFLEMGDLTNPSPGEHQVLTRNASMVMDGVIISARPEIITENIAQGCSFFTKLRLSKSRVSADSQEIVLLVLLHYGQQQSYSNLLFSLEKTRLIDCFSKTIIFGHQIGRHRYQQLRQALAEIRRLWPEIELVN